MVAQLSDALDRNGVVAQLGTPAESLRNAGWYGRRQRQRSQACRCKHAGAAADEPARMMKDLTRNRRVKEELASEKSGKFKSDKSFGKKVEMFDDAAKTLAFYKASKARNNWWGSLGDADFDEQQASPTRERFVETAYWNPVVVTGKDGKARVSFKAPSALSEYRITARGITGADTLAGQTTAPLTVRKNFFVDLKVPASLTQGDKPRFVAQVHHTGVTGKLALGLRSTPRRSRGGLPEDDRDLEGRRRRSRLRSV